MLCNQKKTGGNLAIDWSKAQYVKEGWTPKKANTNFNKKMVRLG